MKSNRHTLLIGWGHADITPDYPVLLRGYFNARVSEGVQDPVTVTALAIEGLEYEKPRDHVIMVSCDLVKISEDLNDEVRRLIRRQLPDVDHMKVILSATHTHTAPETHRSNSSWGSVGIDYDTLGVISSDKYVEDCANQIVIAIKRAWQHRRPGGVSWALGHAVIAHNRLMTYKNGQSAMYGDTNNPDFSHVEGYEDHTIDILYTWTDDRVLTGVAVNVPCPAQAGGGFKISADFWHEARTEIKRRLGQHLFVLGLCGPAGDQSPRPLIRVKAVDRMQSMTGRSLRQQIGDNIARAVNQFVPVMNDHIDRHGPFAHVVETVHLTRRKLSEQDVKSATREIETGHQIYTQLLTEINENPALKSKPRWYTEVTRAHALLRRHERVIERFELEKKSPTYSAEIHVIRLGEFVIATNPFELYVDYGMQIQARSAALQTMVVELSGPGTGNFYIPTERSIAHGGYGAVPASTIVGPEGGRELVERTVHLIDRILK